jgi:hypothetical protein
MDTLLGGEGTDVLGGGPGDDFIDGGAGVDVLSGDSGDDRIAGGEGNDTLSGGPGADSLFGDGGDDLLTGGPGKDYFVGGSGVDRMVDAQPDEIVIDGVGNAEVRINVNEAPVVVSIVPIPTRIDVGETVALTITAEDADGDTMSATWRAGCSGHFDNPALWDARFTLDLLESAECTLDVQLADNAVASTVLGLTSGVQTIAVGVDQTCAVVQGIPYCWGYNGWGQLGNGTTTPSLVPVIVTGL